MFLCKRNGIYYLWFVDDEGRRRKTSTRSRTKSGALQFLQSFKSSKSESISVQRRVMFSEVLKEYTEISKGIHTPSTHRTYLDSLNQAFSEIGEKAFCEIGAREIESFLTRKRLEVSNWTARKHHIVLLCLFEAAKRWGYIAVNPCRDIKRARMVEVQPAFFTPEEFAKPYQTIGDTQFRDLVLLAISTGMRLGEITSLEWRNLDLSRKVIQVANTNVFTTKSKKMRIVPMSEAVLEMLMRRTKRQGSDYVFHLDGRRLLDDHVSKTFKKHVKQAGVNPRLHFHSLRHSFCSLLVQQGATLYEVQKLAGHSSPSVTQIYSHLQPETLHNTVNKIQINLN
jgi:site-specific recombinase XerD